VAGTLWLPPAGTRRVRAARLEVFEPEAEVVRRIYDDYVNGGHSIRQIVRRLNTDDIPTPTGKSEWWHSTVCRVLRNEAYIGRVYFNQTESVPTRSRTGQYSTTQKRRPQEEWIAVPCPPFLMTSSSRPLRKSAGTIQAGAPVTFPKTSKLGCCGGWCAAERAG